MRVRETTGSSRSGGSSRRPCLLERNRQLTLRASCGNAEEGCEEIVYRRCSAITTRNAMDNTRRATRHRKGISLPPSLLSPSPQPAQHTALAFSSAVYVLLFSRMGAWSVTVSCRDSDGPSLCCSASSPPGPWYTRAGSGSGPGPGCEGASDGPLERESGRAPAAGEGGRERAVRSHCAGGRAEWLDSARVAAGGRHGGARGETRERRSDARGG